VIHEQILGALEERACNRVEVRLVIDAIGSPAYPDNAFRALRNAGGKMS
jgi:phosphatidylserine/phosphatidylglycerophosphate/cardiolipin synthase-like enzyme